MLIVGNREPRVFYVGLDRRDIQVDEGFGETFADKQFGSGDMIWRHRCVGGSLREGHLIAGQVGDIGATPIISTDSTHVSDVMT